MTDEGHLTAHVRFNVADFATGCTCGWRGPLRSTLQTAIADCLAHCRPFVPHVQACSMQDCPIDARPVLGPVAGWVVDPAVRRG